MKAIISTTYDDKYLYFLPIVTWCWNKIGVDVVCFNPLIREEQMKKWQLIARYILNGTNISFQFNSPETKDATYSQCSRLFAAAINFPEDEVLITSDIDMAVFGDYLKQKVAGFDIFGYDLCPENQYPICYISATVKAWREAMQINGRTCQQCLDDLLGGIEDIHMRGNYWAKDQEEAFLKISQHNDIHLHARAKPGTQFATNRVDRDDMFWEERITPSLIDAHLWRPGYTDENFPKILKLMKTMYPYEDFQWLINYNEEYKRLL